VISVFKKCHETPQFLHSSFTPQTWKTLKK